MSKDNKTIVEKADIAVSNLIGSGGYLNPIQANTFIRMLIEQPTLINEVRVVPMNSPTMEINKIGFTSRILQPAPASGTALAASKRSAPVTDKVTLTTKEVIAEVHIPYDVLEDNIERGSLEDTIMTLISERASLDLEELILLGKLGSSDAYLALLNGVLNQLTSHVVDFGGNTNITKAIFKALIKAMPNKYLRNQAAMRFYVSPDTEIEYADILADRNTLLGDRNIERWPYGMNVAFGIPVKGVALMPNWAGVLTYPKNIILGVQRQIMIETDRDIRARVLIVVLTMRMDVKFEEEDAGVKVIGLEPSATTTTTTTAP